MSDGKSNDREDVGSSEATDSSHDARRLELVFGVVGPTGIDIDHVVDVLTRELRSMDYASDTVHLSHLILKKLNHDGVFGSEYERIDTLMKMGTHLKDKADQPDMVARFAIQAVRAFRKRKADPSLGRAYIVRSFKRKEEVALFRSIYGEQFILISLYSPKESRIEYVRRRLGPTMKLGELDAGGLSKRLSDRDYQEDGVNNGQQVGKTFPLADYFVNTDSRPQLEADLHRLVRLTFGDPYISPTKEEEGMFFAQAAALRSLDLSRQVGACINVPTSDSHSPGGKAVPRAGGGLYWAADKDVARDAEVGFDSNVIIKRHILEDALDRLGRAGWLNASIKDRPISELLSEALLVEGAFLEESTFYDVIEYGRAVHAEMAAITAAARSGIKIEGGTLYCTTFPCHICARHIVSAGLRRVLFVEPYEKSRVRDLYPDSIAIEPRVEIDSRVSFCAFTGTAPRRYMDFFQSRGSKKKKDGSVLGQAGLASYKRWEKKIYHVDLLEKLAIDETKQVPFWPPTD